MKKTRKFYWTGSDIVEVAGVHGLWEPNVLKDENEFTEDEIKLLLSCPGIKISMEEE